MKLGQFIRKLREEKDISLREFADKLDLTPSFISDVELGRRNPGEKVLESIASFFGVTVDEMKQYDERVPEDVRKIIQSSPGAGAAVGVLLRKAAEKEKITDEDIKKIIDSLNQGSK